MVQPVKYRSAPPRRTPSRFTPWRHLKLQSFLIVASASCVLAYPVYTVLQQAVTHGIHQQGNLLVVDMMAMSSFRFDQASGTDNDIPRVYRGLDGKRVELSGEIYLPNTAGGPLDKFQLVYSIAACCFGGPPRVQCFVNATVMPGPKCDYIRGIVNVVGTLHVGVERVGGQVASVYRMDVEEVKQ
jgi:hypothetical protein